MFPRTLPRLSLFFSLLAAFVAPAFVAPTSVAPVRAAEYSLLPGPAPQIGKSKKGDAPPRPRPKPGPRDGGDDE